MTATLLVPLVFSAGYTFGAPVLFVRATLLVHFVFVSQTLFGRLHVWAINSFRDGYAVGVIRFRVILTFKVVTRMGHHYLL